MTASPAPSVQHWEPPDWSDLRDGYAAYLAAAAFMPATRAKYVQVLDRLDRWARSQGLALADLTSEDVERHTAGKAHSTHLYVVSALHSLQRWIDGRPAKAKVCRLPPQVLTSRLGERWVEQYRRWLTVTLQASPSTTRNYLYRTSQFAAWCRVNGFDLLSADTDNVSDYLQEQLATTRRVSVQSVFYAVRNLYRCMAEIGERQDNPTDGIRFKHPQQPATRTAGGR